MEKSFPKLVTTKKDMHIARGSSLDRAIVNTSSLVLEFVNIVDWRKGRKNGLEERRDIRESFILGGTNECVCLQLSVAYKQS